MIRKISIYSLMVIGLIIAVCLEKNISGKHYASLAIALAFSVYFTGEMVYGYIQFRRNYKNEYDLFKVQLINSNESLTLEKIELKNKEYYRRFKRKKLKESTYKMFLIFCGVGLMLAMILGLSL